jgi:hypothetical protein
VPLDQFVEAGPSVVLATQDLVGERSLLQPLCRPRIMAGLIRVHDAVGLVHRETDHPFGMARVRRAGEMHERFVVSAVSKPIANGADRFVDQAFGQV